MDLIWNNIKNILKRIEDITNTDVSDADEQTLSFTEEEVTDSF